MLYKAFFMKKLDLKKRYAKENSYVLITGCTSGIGEAIAYEFAREGMNIILVSRSMDKLNKVKDECLIINKSIDIKIVQADFSNGDDLSLYEKIYN